jgi:hypothetical protein
MNQNWKTSVFGALAIIFTLLEPVVPAQYKDAIQKAASAATGAGLVAAADSKKKSE